MQYNKLTRLNFVSAGDRIYEARKAAGLTQQQVADAVGVTKSSVAQWESGLTKNLRGENLVKVAKILNTSPDWLALGQPTAANISGDSLAANGSNVSPGPDLYYLPLISWIQAGEWTEISNHHPGDYEQLVPVTRRYSSRAFALKIVGDSMQAPDGDSFPEGAIISVEPLQEARNGSYVVAQNGHREEATFKQLVIDGNRRYLKPLNPRYPIIEITEEITICGVVRQLVMDFDR